MSQKADERDRQYLLVDVRTYRHARSMRIRKNISQDTWDVAYWAARHLEDRIRNRLDWMGGLMGEW